MFGLFKCKQKQPEPLNYPKAIEDIAKEHGTTPRELVLIVLDSIPFDVDKCYRKVAEDAGLTNTSCWKVISWLEEQNKVKTYGIRVRRLK